METVRAGPAGSAVGRWWRACGRQVTFGGGGSESDPDRVGHVRESLTRKGIPHICREMPYMDGLPTRSEPRSDPKWAGRSHPGHGKRLAAPVLLTSSSGSIGIV